MQGADFRAMAYMYPPIFQRLERDDRLPELAEYDLIVSYHARLDQLAAMAEHGGEDQLRLINLSWVALKPLDRHPDWRVPEDANWDFSYWLSKTATEEGHDDFFTGGTFRAFGGGDGILAPIDKHAYFKLFDRALRYFLPVWRALGYHGIMLEWGWFSKWIRWFLGDPKDSVLDPAMLTRALNYFHWILTTRVHSYGMYVVNQHLSAWGCPSDRHRLAFDGCKWENPWREVESFHCDKARRWDSRFYSGPGWWKRQKLDMEPDEVTRWLLTRLNYFEIQRHPQHADAKVWERRFREHVEAAMAIGAAVCWYNTDRPGNTWPRGERNYHAVLPQLPVFYRG